MLLRHCCRFWQQCCRFRQQCRTKFSPFDKVETNRTCSIRSTLSKGQNFVRHCCRNRQHCWRKRQQCRSNLRHCRKNRSTCSVRQCCLGPVHTSNNVEATLSKQQLLRQCCRFGQHCRSNVRICREDKISTQNSFDRQRDCQTDGCQTVTLRLSLDAAGAVTNSIHNGITYDLRLY